MSNWCSYRDLRGHGPDFVVQYRLYPPSEGGREVVYQHLRRDWSYEGDDPATDGIFVIHPEFLDADGRPLPDGVAVPLEGRASMWILVPEMRGQVHRRRVEVGGRGHFMEGQRRIADAVVVELVGLHANPRADSGE